MGAELFHCYPDGSERPIFNASKLLSGSQSRGSAGNNLCGTKFHPYLYGRKFILVTDHKPLLALFDPTKAVLELTLNRLTRWALILQQYNYTIEYRKTSEHGNADALSRLPSGEDKVFDDEEKELEFSNVCSHSYIESTNFTGSLILLQMNQRKTL